MIIKAVLMEKGIFVIEVTKRNYKKVRLKLLSEQEKIIRRLKEYKEAGLIKSIYYPCNKKMQPTLDKFVEMKREIKKSLRMISHLM